MHYFLNASGRGDGRGYGRITGNGSGWGHRYARGNGPSPNFGDAKYLYGNSRGSGWGIGEGYAAGLNYVEHPDLLTILATQGLLR